MRPRLARRCGTSRPDTKTRSSAGWNRRHWRTEISAEEEAAAAEGRADIAAGRMFSLDEVKRNLGLA
ncbi:MAG TPA: hypothetical protein VNV37_04500 [Solirubrobacteraceae bacterium]|nr:hypothetical protein [Solirubrobacteraceae bacterium]